MVLFLSNEDMEQIEGLETAAITDLIERAYGELGEGSAASPPRCRLTAPLPDGSATYWFNIIMGAVPSMQTMALRFDSTFFRLIDVEGLTRKVRAGDFVGLVLLF